MWGGRICRRRLAWWLAAAFLVLSGTTDWARACPGCVGSMEGTGGAAAIGLGFSWSILFMLCVPLAAGGVLAATIARACRQVADAERRGEAFDGSD